MDMVVLTLLFYLMYRIGFLHGYKKATKRYSTQNQAIAMELGRKNKELVIK